jgi:hypothetical protein
MQNDFLRATKLALSTHGASCTYTRVVNSEYNVETGTAGSSENNYLITAYKKHIRATQYNFPNLVNKEAALFYIAGDSLKFKPAPKDKITYSSEVYTIEDVQEHIAMGAIVLYRVAAVKV